MMTSLIRMEMLKLLRRPMTWVLLSLLLCGLTLVDVVVLARLGGLHGSDYQSTLRSLTLPLIIPNALKYVGFFGALLLAILAASSIGSEYSWGTLRPAISTGVGRSRFLTAKLAALVIVEVGFLLASVVLGVVLGIVVAHTEGRSVLPEGIDWAWFGDLLAMLGRTFFVMLVPMLIAFFFGILGRSQGTGIGVTLGFLITEQVSENALGELGRWGVFVQKLLLSTANETLIDHNTFGLASIPAGFPSEWRAALTLAVYGLLCLVLSLSVFARRDIRGSE